MENKYQNKHVANRNGVVLLLMLLIIVVVFGLLWLDPTALFSKKDPSLPWNQEDRLVKADEKIPPPGKLQLQLTKNLFLSAKLSEKGQSRGEIAFIIRTDGKIKGTWSANYWPEPKVLREIFMGDFEGNIDPSKIHSGEKGEDLTKLYIYTKGKFLILETNNNTGKVRKISGNIYVTGWIDPDYTAKGKLIITSDKKQYKEFTWEGVLVEKAMLFM